MPAIARLRASYAAAREQLVAIHSTRSTTTTTTTAATTTATATPTPTPTSRKRKRFCHQQTEACCSSSRVRFTLPCFPDDDDGLPQLQLLLWPVVRTGTGRGERTRGKKDDSRRRSVSVPPSPVFAEEEEGLAAVVTFDTGVLEYPLLPASSSLLFRAAETDMDGDEDVVPVATPRPPSSSLQRIPHGAGANALLDRWEDAFQDNGSGGSYNNGDGARSNNGLGGGRSCSVIMPQFLAEDVLFTLRFHLETKAREPDPVLRKALCAVGGTAVRNYLEELALRPESEWCRTWLSTPKPEPGSVREDSTRREGSDLQS
jgi:hypothetical protein